MKGYTTLIPDVLPSTGVFALDTVELFSALVGDPKLQRTLERVCRMLELDESLDCFHNAGNDAHVMSPVSRSRLWFDVFFSSLLWHVDLWLWAHLSICSERVVGQDSPVQLLRLTSNPGKMTVICQTLRV